MGGGLGGRGMNSSPWGFRVCSRRSNMATAGRPPKRPLVAKQLKDLRRKRQTLAYVPPAAFPPRKTQDLLRTR